MMASERLFALSPETTYRLSRETRFGAEGIHVYVLSPRRLRNTWRQKNNYEKGGEEKKEKIILRE